MAPAQHPNRYGHTVVVVNGNIRKRLRDSDVCISAHRTSPILAFASPKKPNIESTVYDDEYHDGLYVYHLYVIDFCNREDTSKFVMKAALKMLGWVSRDVSLTPDYLVMHLLHNVDTCAQTVAGLARFGEVGSSEINGLNFTAIAIDREDWKPPTSYRITSKLVRFAVLHHALELHAIGKLDSFRNENRNDNV